MRERIVGLANDTLTADLQEGEKEEWGLGPSHRQTAAQILDTIDRGTFNGGPTGSTCTPAMFGFTKSVIQASFQECGLWIL